MSQHLTALVSRRSKQPAKPDLPSSEFAGNLTSMSFADVLQLLQVGRKTGVLALASAGKKGEIGLDSGEVRQAVAPGQAGDEAFYTLASWKGASFAFTTGPLQGAPNITSPTMPLLMEAMRRVDEASRAPESGAAPGETSLNELF